MNITNFIIFFFSASFSFACHADESDLFADARRAFQECSILASGIAYAKSSQALCVKGNIDYSLARDFGTYLKNTEQLGDKIRYVVISGQGGELRPAIEIGSKIGDAKLDVVVGDICASSCAQFLFVAGKRKIMLTGGVVLFHGGPIPNSMIDAMNLPASAELSIHNQNREFEEFYSARKIDMRMLTDPPDEIRARIASGELVMWSWPQKNLEDFGVTDIHEER